MDVVTLVALAGNALVQAMVTHGWEGVRHKALVTVKPGSNLARSSG